MKILKLTTLIALLFLPVVADGQLQQSGGGGSAISGLTLGGNAVTALATGELNSNLARVGGNATATGNGVATTGSQRVTIASDNTAFSVNATLQAGAALVGKVGIDQTTPGTTNKVSIGTDGTVALNSALPAGTNMIGIIKTVPSNSCGTTVFNQAWAAVPTSNTAITATTTCKAILVFTNTNGSAQTVSVTDGQGSPITAIGPAFSVPGLSTVRFELEGAMTTGIKWLAGGTGVTGSAMGYQ
jgi:hypothetical protein